MRHLPASLIIQAAAIPLLIAAGVAGSVYLPEQLDSLMMELVELVDPFTVAAFRDRTGLTRKYAVPLLEWMDTFGVTSRSGDVRSVVARPVPGVLPEGGNQLRPEPGLDDR